MTVCLVLLVFSGAKFCLGTFWLLSPLFPAAHPRPFAHPVSSTHGLSYPRLKLLFFFFFSLYYNTACPVLFILFWVDHGLLVPSSPCAFLLLLLLLQNSSRACRPLFDSYTPKRLSFVFIATTSPPSSFSPTPVLLSLAQNSFSPLI